VPLKGFSLIFLCKKSKKKYMNAETSVGGLQKPFNFSEISYQAPKTNFNSPIII
jgi:hypothetical protein